MTDYIRAPGIEFRETGNEIFLVGPDGQTLHHLNPVGSAIWRLLDEPLSPSEAAEILKEAFPDVDGGRIDADVAAVFKELAARGLVAAATCGHDGF